jgi:hypothetical protein
MEKKLRELKEMGILNDVSFFSVLSIVTEFKADVLSMIEDWEAGIDPEDKTLYSLALRRTVDLINGNSSVDNRDEEG